MASLLNYSKIGIRWCKSRFHMDLQRNNNFLCRIIYSVSAIGKLDELICFQCSVSTSPENIRKPEVFEDFRWYRNVILGKNGLM